MNTRYTNSRKEVKVMNNFILSCESTIDMPYSYISGRGLEVLFYSYTVNGETYPDDMERDPNSLPQFYERLKLGYIPTTSQINQFAYEEFFKKFLDEGKDILHLCFGTGMTQSYSQAVNAVEALKEKYPDRKIVVIDTTCSSSGYGLIVDDAADLYEEGKSIEEIAKYVEDNKYHIHHQFYTTDLKYFKRTGRVSGPAASIGAVLKICPLMHLNHAGKIIAYSKVMGKKNALKATLDWMENHADNGKDYNGKIFISHSNALDDANKTKDEIEKRFPNLIGKVRIFNIGTIIASHTGPGTVAVYFHGDERQ